MSPGSGGPSARPEPRYCSLQTEVVSTITSTATAGKVTSAGTGSPNKLLYTGTGGTTPPTATAPAAPTIGAVTPASKSIKVDWTKGSDGGSPLTSQSIRVYRSSTSGGSFTYNKTVSVSGSATTGTVTSLSTRYYYRFSVTATNAIGTSPESLRSGSVKPQS